MISNLIETKCKSFTIDPWFINFFPWKIQRWLKSVRFIIWNDHMGPFFELVGMLYKYSHIQLKIYVPKYYDPISVKIIHLSIVIRKCILLNRIGLPFRKDDFLLNSLVRHRYDFRIIIDCARFCTTTISNCWDSM